MLQTLSEFYFSRKSDEIFFRSKSSELAIKTYSLVMSQSLHNNPNLRFSNSAEFNASSRKYTFVRRNELRLISAFNKKVIFRNGSLLKYYLLYSSGLQNVKNFDDYIRILIDRRRNNLFLDRHFRPIPAFDGSGLCIDIDARKDVILANDNELLQVFSIKKKSSEEVAGTKSIFKFSECSDHQRDLLKEYIELP